MLLESLAHFRCSHLHLFSCPVVLYVPQPLGILKIFSYTLCNRASKILPNACTGLIPKFITFQVLHAHFRWPEKILVSWTGLSPAFWSQVCFLERCFFLPYIVNHHYPRHILHHLLPLLFSPWCSFILVQNPHSQKAMRFRAPAHFKADLIKQRGLQSAKMLSLWWPSLRNRLS